MHAFPLYKRVKQGPYRTGSPLVLVGLVFYHLSHKTKVRELEIQWQKEGDSLAHYLAQISEMTKSVKIIQQVLERILRSSYKNLEIR
ncbi:hypothetical protein J1N35_018229 [Gossypium stocksii]|uniref:NADH-quinone oxidoreductase subunit D domain-containing protein n=1 Tax=Gossypium stocksii TaxID=47602 RepID=A0A9D3VPG4_9ROSI|nr:hypothetical protein J1N35_018229 [Gossypium stocksii]